MGHTGACEADRPGGVTATSNELNLLTVSFTSTKRVWNLLWFPWKDLARTLINEISEIEERRISLVPGYRFLGGG